MKRSCCATCIDCRFAALTSACGSPAPTSCPTHAPAPSSRTGRGAGSTCACCCPIHHTDAKPIRQASHKYFDELLASGVKIYEYQGTMLHAKLVVVDGRWSLVGSANMDVRSKELNAENVMGILDEDFARQLEATFLEDLRRARPIERAAWRRQPRTKGWVENFRGLFAEQY